METSGARVEQLCWELRRAFRELAAAGDQALQPLGLKAADRALLELLAREPGPVSLAGLARKRSVSRQHIHQTLRRLPDATWVRTRPDPEDRRSLLLELSPSGRRMWQEVRRRDVAFFTRLERQLTRKEVEAGLVALRHLRAAIGAEGKDDA